MWKDFPLFLPNPIVSRSAVDGVQSNQHVGRRIESISLRFNGQLCCRDTQRQLNATPGGCCGIVGIGGREGATSSGATSTGGNMEGQKTDYLSTTTSTSASDIAASLRSIAHILLQHQRQPPFVPPCAFSHHRLRSFTMVPRQQPPSSR